jgi:hypothetical protein
LGSIFGYSDNWSLLDAAWVTKTDYKLLETEEGVVVFCDASDVYYSTDFGAAYLNRTGALPGGHQVIALPRRVW